MCNNGSTGQPADEQNLHEILAMQRKVELTLGGGKGGGRERVEREELVLMKYAARSTPGHFISINQEIAFLV